MPFIVRRRRPGTTFALTLAACAASALFLPGLGFVQNLAAKVLVPVSHPAKLAGNGVAGWFEDDRPADPASPGSPREFAQVVAENQALRQQLERLTAQLEVLRQLNQDREALGDDLRPRTAPAAVVGQVDGESDLLEVAAAGGMANGLKAIGIHDGEVAIVGSIIDAAGPLARVRLTTDRGHRPFGARFTLFEDGKFVTLPTEPFLVEGTGGGLAVARHRTADLEQAGVKVGQIALLDDPDWPELLVGLRVGVVTRIEALPREPGFSRVDLAPAVPPERLKEVLVLVNESSR